MTTTTPTEGSAATFADLGVAPELCEPLADIGIHNPFPIQEITLPLALSGADVIGQARTGTGKTLAFGLPLLQRIAPGERRTVALVIVPTRELCLQVRDDLAHAAGRKGIEVLAVYGGRSLDPQIEALRQGVPVVVGTPGRLLDLHQRGTLDLSGVTSLVLDEADEMLDLGFLPDVERLIESTAPRRQTMLFSATMPSAIVGLARRYMSKPTFLRAEVEESRIAPETRQHFFSCHRMDKPAVLARILQAPERGLCVVFTRTKRMADILASELGDRGIAAAPIHSDLRQEARERALKRFRQGKTDVLVATEVAARGLDIDDLTHVVNYDCPDDEKMYLHRIGRTGRAGGAGVAITLAVWNELARVEMIKRALDIDEQTHEVFSTSQILDDLFDLPPREARQAPSARDWDRAVNRGRSGGRGSSGRRSTGGGRDARSGDRRTAERRGGQPGGRSATGARAAGTAGAQSGAAGAEASRSVTPAAGREPGQEGGRRRMRRRQRDGGEPAAAAAPRGTREAAGPAGDAGGDAARHEEATVSRVRRRTRTGERAPEGRDEGPESSRPGPGTAAGDTRRRPVSGRRDERAGSSGPGGRERSGRDSERSGGGSERSGGRERSGGGSERSGGRGRSGGGSERSGGGKGRSAGRKAQGSGRTRAGDTSGGNGRRSGGGRGRASGDSRPGGSGGDRRRSGGRSSADRRRDDSTGSRTVDSTAARGEGQPRLRRPLEVVHLP